ncbi:MAG: M24 family metallopeptidase [Rhodospirillales bacterium]|nr:M24 family metallopeptidase [Rhodospirillales bacterium]
MQTMHLVLPVGAHDWENNPVPESEFRQRHAAIRQMMSERGWSGVVVFGDIPASGLLGYVSNFAPRLRPAFALIPKSGEPRILTLDGGRMVDAGKATTWIEDVRPAMNIAETIREWLDELEGGQGLAVADFDLMPADLFAQISALDEITSAVDASSDLRALARRKSDQEIAVIKNNCRLLSEAATAAEQANSNGASGADCVVAAERSARAAGVQDVRCLYSLDGGNSFQPFEGLDDRTGDPLVLYIALKNRGYWVEGFITTGNAGAAKEALDAMIAIAKAGTTAKEFAQLRDRSAGSFKSHPILGERAGNGIGNSVDEAPFLVSGDEETLQDGDVVSLKVGIGDAGSHYGWASAILHIEKDGTEMLWPK